MTGDAVRQYAGAGTGSDVPIFVVGMPRSGTTLVEQILASHQDVFGGGELSALTNLAFREFRNVGLPAPFPEFFSADCRDALAVFGDHYVRRLRSLAPEAKRVTDKLPGNFALLGLIHVALPNAKIIVARRDPLDVCLSCFSMPFGDDLGYTYDLGELGRLCRAYGDIMEHWRNVLPAGAFLEISYEDLVKDVEGEARRMLSFLGLPWTPSVLKFYETARPVRTASSVQVRQPLFRSSVGRWRRYSKFLGPLIAALGDDKV